MYYKFYFLLNHFRFFRFSWTLSVKMMRDGRAVSMAQDIGSCSNSIPEMKYEMSVIALYLDISFLFYE